MDLQQAQRQLTTRLTPLHGPREAALIADWVMESLTGRKRLDRLVHSTELLSPAALEKYNQYTAALLAHTPVQYVLHEAHFAGLKFYVDNRVLIPRPETEELVDWIATTISNPGPISSTPSGPLLDVGTGSGCIAITLAKKLPATPIHAVDTSEDALAVARRNAAALDAPIQFHHLDFLDPDSWQQLPAVQWLVSNPPYIPQKERDSMAPHVTDAEPALALFVPDDDPLLFYKALAAFAKTKLTANGAIFVEIHEDLASGVMEAFRTAGFQQITLRQDMQGRDRMIKTQYAP